MAQDVVVMILGDDVACTSLEGAVHEFVVVWVGGDEVQVEIDLYLTCVGEIQQRRDDVGGNGRPQLPGEDFLIFHENLVGIAEHIGSCPQLLPHGVVAAAARKRHEQAVGVEDDVHWA